ncbi:hypothetical protein AcV5_005122 [Taiwanofungus camphoratus]|nr:hypothetical protein AcV5_005122 [Antrodia cinnamomea]KAI0962370.1 hypothetical protein AcV7_001228 [Antrodia cinnamomea]
MSTSLGQLYHVVHRAFRKLAPLPQDCELLTVQTLPDAFIYIIPYLLMSYLARRKNTQLLRLFLLPVVIVMAIHCAYRYKSQNTEHYITDRDRCMLALIVIAHSCQFAFAKDGIFKVGEKKLRQMDDVVTIPFEDGSAPVVETDIKPHVYRLLPAWMSDGLEAGLALRGLGWDFGRGVYVPRNYRPAEREAFLKATATSLLKHILIVDFCDAYIRLLPGIGTVQGGSIFRSDLPFFWRYTVSTTVHTATGIFLIKCLDLCYDFFALFAVAALDHSPSAWPPFSDSPWESCSLHEFWGKRWHQGLKRTCLVFGGYPGRWLAGDIGMVMGTFLVSGLFHEVTTYTYGKGLDHRTTVWFVLQGIGMIMERVWRQKTGRRVGGLAGRAWTAFFVLGLGQMFTDAWYSRGITIVGAPIIPEGLSPTKCILWPILRYIATTLSTR